MTLLEMENLLDRVRYKDWQFLVNPEPLYLQVKFLASTTQYGRKWLLSRHMTPSEVVQTALKAVLAAEEHEARERFLYRGRPIFGPHFNVERLVELYDREDSLDVRGEPVIHGL